MKPNPSRSRMAAARLGLALAAGALFLLSRSATGAEKFYLNAAEGGVASYRNGPRCRSPLAMPSELKPCT